jgi:bifunctional non-homologous end joining protein LigD
LIRHPSFLNLREDLDLNDCISVPSAEDTIGVEFSLTGQKKVVFSNLSKILWEDSGYTKGDLVNYYRDISGMILPYLKDRFLVMDRYPDGINGKSFFQKNAGNATPNWVKTEQLWDSKSGQRTDYIVCSDQETLLLVANWASIPIHIWGSRVQSLLNPDWCILDLDPTETTFEQVTRVALEIRSTCEEIGIKPFVKTSGGKGLHLLIPAGRSCNFDQARMIAEVIALMVVHRIPDLATVERSLERRAGKVYIDCLQNGYGKLLVAPYCVRPLPGAPVSTPLEWDEVNDQLSPMDFDMRTVLERTTQMGYDPLERIFEVSIDLPSILQRVERTLEQGDWFV